MPTATTFPELSVEEAADLITRGEAVIIDVNPRRRWASGHLPGAINLDPATFTIAEIPGGMDVRLIIYCMDGGGAASRFAAQRAAKLGFTHVFTMPGGLKGWMAAGHRAKAGR